MKFSALFLTLFIAVSAQGFQGDTAPMGKCTNKCENKASDVSLTFCIEN